MLSCVFSFLFFCLFFFLGNSLKWLVVECHLQPPPAGSSSPTEVLLRPSYFVLVLRGESLRAELFKNESRKIKECHKTARTHQSVPSLMCVPNDQIAVRQLVADYNTAARADGTGVPQLWVPPNAPIARTLFSISEPSTSDSFVQSLIQYHSDATEKAQPEHEVV